MVQSTFLTGKTLSTSFSTSSSFSSVPHTWDLLPAHASACLRPVRCYHLVVLIRQPFISVSPLQISLAVPRALISLSVTRLHTHREPTASSLSSPSLSTGPHFPRHSPAFHPSLLEATGRCCRRVQTRPYSPVKRGQGRQQGRAGQRQATITAFPPSMTVTTVDKAETALHTDTRTRERPPPGATNLRCFSTGSAGISSTARGWTSWTLEEWHK